MTDKHLSSELRYRCSDFSGKFSQLAACNPHNTTLPSISQQEQNGTQFEIHHISSASIIRLLNLLPRSGLQENVLNYRNTDFAYNLWGVHGCAEVHEKWKCYSLSHVFATHGLKPTRLPCPRNSPGKNTEVGHHSLLQENLPDSGIKPRSPALQTDSLSSEPPRDSPVSPW